MISRLHVSQFPRGLLTILLGLFLLTGAAPAANQTVTSLADSGAGSLRDAIALVGIGETINFAVTGVILLTSGKLLITDHLTITGPGASALAIKGPGFGVGFTIFEVAGGANVKISGLTITNSGGIKLNFSTFTLEDCVITDNKSVSTGGGGLQSVGGTLTVRNCLFRRNQVWSYPGPGYGGGISAASGTTVPATTVVENSTFFDNSAVGGGGIYQVGGSLTVTHCTFYNNHATSGYPLDMANCIDMGLRTAGYLANTILQTPGYEGPALRVYPGTNITGGYNLCSDHGSRLLTGPGDRIWTDSKLDPTGPQNHGGPTATIALLADSPAVDQGKSFGVTTDQRGQLRPRDLALFANAVGGDGSDIGAFEASDFEQTGPDFVVTTTADHDDGIAGLVDCTLREALRVLNSSGEAGTITLDSPLGQLDVTTAVTLAGPGARKLALSGADGVRPILSFAVGSTGSAVSGLTVRNGQRIGSFVDGAGLANLGTLTVADCAFVNNIARALSGSQPGQAGGRARGGAVFNGGTLTLNRCSFSGNTAHGGNGANNSAQFGSGGSGGAGLGGAVFNDTNATLAVNNCTFFNNTGTGGNGGNDLNFGGGNGGQGFGGVFNQGTMTMTACTLNGNTATGGTGGLGNAPINNGASGAAGGGLNAGAGTNNVRNTISAGNTGGSSPDVSGAFTSQGWNLLGKSNGSSGFTATGDQTGTSAAPLNANLSPFGNYGGPNNTLLLLSGSPALDKGKAFGLATDQLNLPRRYDDPALPNASGGDGTDIGAVEMQPAYSGPLKVLSLTLVGPTARVVIQGTASMNYQLQKTDALTNTLGTSFANLGTPQITDSIGQTEFTDFGPLPAYRFYRALKP